MRAARALLLLGGGCLVAVGTIEVWHRLTVGQAAGLGVWLAAAVVVHDGVIAPLTALLSRSVERRGGAFVPAARGIVRVGLVVGAVLTLVGLPGVVAQGRGTANPTVLTQDYAAVLGIVWAAVIALTIAGVVVAQRRSDVRAS